MSGLNFGFTWVLLQFNVDGAYTMPAAHIRNAKTDALAICWDNAGALQLVRRRKRNFVEDNFLTIAYIASVLDYLNSYQITNT